MNCYAKQSVYFAQQKDGGPFKIGCSQNVATRINNVGQLFPQGAELIVALDGGFAREAVLHRLLSAHRLWSHEWFRACPDVWRLTLDALDTGLPWLPAEPNEADWRAMQPSFRDRTLSLFGSVKAAAAAAGIQPVTLQSTLGQGWRPSLGLWVAVVLQEARQANALPDYVRTFDAPQAPNRPATVKSRKLRSEAHKKLWADPAYRRQRTLDRRFHKEAARRGLKAPFDPAAVRDIEAEVAAAYDAEHGSVVSSAMRAA